MTKTPRDLYDDNPDLAERAWTIAAQGTVEDIPGCLMREGVPRDQAERAYRYVLSVY